MPTDAVRFPVEAAHVMFFARAIGDDNPIYVDEEYAGSTEVGHTIAPPTFVTAVAQFDPDHDMRPRAGQPWIGSGANAQSAPIPARQGGLHAEEHLEFHRHPAPGETLTMTRRPGRTWTKGGRSGRLEFRETWREYRDAAGELVVSERRVSVFTGEPTEGQ